MRKIVSAIPESMIAVCLDDTGMLTHRNMPVPRPGAGEVLIKMSAAPVNPSDLARIKHAKGTSDQIKMTPGLEGSGKVIEHGKGLLPMIWQGRRVVCSPSYPLNGTWAEYLVTAASRCMPLPSAISDEQGAMLLVNPLTAVAFIKIANAHRHKAFVNTAAAGSLGRMTERIASLQRKPVINIVHNQKQKDELLEKGSKYVIDSSKENFREELSEMANHLNATLFLDAIGGSMTRELLLAAPAGSTVMIYGNLSSAQPEIDHRSLVTDNKKVTGFLLTNWLKEISPLQMLDSIIRARKLLKNDFTIPVNERFPLTEAQIAVNTYLAGMSKGKVLLVS